MNWYVEVLKKYAVFAGRARRKEYWMFTLFNLIIGFAIGFVQGMMGIGGGSYLAWPALVYTLAVLIPGIAVSVRRLHDTNRSGWWLFIACVPFIGAVALLWFMVQEGTPGDNQYGPNPKSPVGPQVYQDQPRVATPVGR
jgi:uncharacterized membrane protein YhaH (DUF805 family)